MSATGDPVDLPPPEPPIGDPFHVTGWHRLRNYFLTGLIIGAPIFLTIYLTGTFIQWVDGIVEPLIPSIYRPDSYLPFAIPGFGVVVAIVFITLIGFLAANYVGTRLVAFGEAMVGRMPLIRNIYRGLKQMFETALSKNTRTFQQVGLIQYPRQGLWAIVFIVTDTKGEVRDRLKDDDDDMVSVFVPATPTPFTGILLFVKRAEVVILDMSIEDAVKMVISAGIVSPEARAKTELAKERHRRSHGRHAPHDKKINPPSAA